MKLQIFKKKREVVPAVTTALVPVRDLQQHIVDCFDEMSGLENKIRVQAEQIEKIKPLEQEKNAALTLTDEYKKRVLKKEQEIIRLEKRIEEKNEAVVNLTDERNVLQIKLAEADVPFVYKKAVSEFAEIIMQNIQNEKGNLSKAKVVNLIKDWQKTFIQSGKSSVLLNEVGSSGSSGSK